MDNFDLKKYLAEGRLFEDDDTTYALHITTVGDMITENPVTHTK